MLSTAYPRTTVKASSLSFAKDQIAHWWLERETAALRFYHIGTLSFPESFLSLLRGEDVRSYTGEIERLMGVRVTEGQVAEVLGNAACMVEGRLDMAMMLAKGIRREVEALREFEDEGSLIQVQKHLQYQLSEADQARAIMLFTAFRNALVHGSDFRQLEVGVLEFRHRDRRFRADYAALAVTWQLLPMIVRELYRAHRAAA